MVWPRLLVMEAPSVRATTSVGPPAANGTTRVIGRVGQLACAWARVAAASAASMTKVRLNCIVQDSLGVGTPVVRHRPEASHPQRVQHREVPERRRRGTGLLALSAWPAPTPPCMVSAS